MAIEFIAILAAPRTGTNYLCGLLRRFNEIDSLYEIYHKQAFYSGNKQLFNRIVEQINDEYKLKIRDECDFALLNFIRQNPQEILEIIKQQSHRKYISFKIFPDHLSQQALKDIIINNNQIKKILIKRNLLNAYFSWQFAKMTKSWSDRDTSRLKLDFDATNFINWYNYYQQYYDFIESEFNQKDHSGDQNYLRKVSILEYEKIHSFETNRDKFIFLLDFLKSIGLELAEDNLSIAEQEFSTLRKKQDRRINVLDKVNNPQLLIDTLKNNQIEDLLKGVTNK